MKQVEELYAINLFLKMFSYHFFLASKIVYIVASFTSFHSFDQALPPCKFSIPKILRSFAT